MHSKCSAPLCLVSVYTSLILSVGNNLCVFFFPVRWFVVLIYKHVIAINEVRETVLHDKFIWSTVVLDFTVLRLLCIPQGVQYVCMCGIYSIYTSM